MMKHLIISIILFQIKAVLSNLDALVKKLSTDQPQREKHETEIGMDIYKRESSHTSLKTDNSSFMWFQLFAEVLLRMSQSSTSKNELIDLCRKGNYEQSNSIIEEFQNSYSSDKSLWWYTRDSFIYRVLNKALRTENLRVLIVFRFLIKDIYEQLKFEQEKQKKNDDTMVFYRGQGITRDELNKIKSSINEFISMRSFLSTTTNLNVAISFIGNNSEEKVLFEIHAKHSSLTPFASISHLSYFQEENEVLFMLGCIFRIENISFDKTMKIWIVKLILSSTQSDHDLKQLLDYLKDEIKSETSFYSLGKILRRMGEYDNAKECFEQHLLQNTNSSIEQSRGYHALGNIYQDCGDLDQSLIYHNYSLKLKLTLSKRNYESIGNSYNSIGAVYEKQGYFLLALRNYEKAKIEWLKCYKEMHERIATIYNNIGIAYRQLDNYFKALESHNKALAIRQKVLPKTHPDIPSSYSNIASVYVKMNELDQALSNYQIAFDIQEKTSGTHKSLALILNNIGSVYETKTNFTLALDYYSRALKIYQLTVPATHPELILTENSIKRCKTKKK